MAGKVQGIAAFLQDYLTTEAIAVGKVFINHAPQSATYPFIVATIITRDESPTQDSGSAVDTYRVQLDVYSQATSSASAFDLAETIAATVRTQLSRVAGIAMITAAGTTIIDGVQESNSFSEYIHDIMVYRVSSDYFIRVK